MMLPTLNKERTMSSIEIADLLGSRHDSVKRSIDRLVEANVISQPPVVDGNKSSNGTVPTFYKICERDTYVIVAQLSPRFTGKLVDRWQELEKGQAPALPQTFSEALQLAADQAKRIEDQDKVLEEQAPKVEVYEKLADRKDSVITSVLAAELKTSAIALNKWLKVNGYKQMHKDLPTYKKRDWFNVVAVVDNKTGKEHVQCLITPLGQIEITKRFNK